ncbi:MAG: hypothetical protein HN370_10565 [Phycisphaerales bacterium]|nr:hypothetical protein [Phycisphaerales bacterium]
MDVVHVTHEAIEKIGGIGTVIEGLCSAKGYQALSGRTVLFGPYWEMDHPLEHSFEGGEMLYHSREKRDGKWGDVFAPIEAEFGVDVIYGHRILREPYAGAEAEAEVLLLDVRGMNPEPVNAAKAILWETYGIPSDRHEAVWDYEQFVRLGAAGLSALRAIGIAAGEKTVILAHEFMGMPTALLAKQDDPETIRTIFYAHEVASVRPVVEKHPGHDTMFYAAMEAATAEGKTLAEVFPEVEDNFKHPLVAASHYCDGIFAVGHYVQKELHFLDPTFPSDRITLSYNALASEELTPAQREKSATALRDYSKRILGLSPTWIFTHVARPVLSKGIWRDFGVLHELDARLGERGETAVFYILGTLGGVRSKAQVEEMAAAYGWPANHVEGYPDVCNGEEGISVLCEAFNASHHNIRAVLVNQWGWSAKALGAAAGEMTIEDLREGADVEFGMSVYEPFGISPLEPLTYGAICVVSNVCGCVGLIEASGAETVPNVLIGDFLLPESGKPLRECLECTTSDRDAVEAVELARLAGELDLRLPRTQADRDAILSAGYALAHRMNWDTLVAERIAPALKRLWTE